jgi:uncharacterized repeat protein (TIGR02543 family)
MKTKKFLTNGFLTLGAVFAILISAFTFSGREFMARGEHSSYSIVFNATKNKLAIGAENPLGYNGTNNAVTELGNNVAFDYNGLTNPSTLWQIFKPSGFITNTSPINGMISLNIEKADIGAHIGVYWSNTTTFDASRYIVFDESSLLNVTTDFNGYKPNYLKVVALGANNSGINNMAITFHCANYYHNITLNNANPTMGSVSGAGLYLTGSNVTISATSNAGYTFSGWYDESDTLKSSDNPYTFVMPSTAATYIAKFAVLTKGKTTHFGMYPQSEVKDATLKTALNSAAGTLPTAGNNELWSDYGYYISGAVSSYMWYIDVINGTDKYRGVYFTNYRPEDTTSPSTLSDSNQDNHGYNINTTYWFKYEPIAWKSLDIVSGKAFLAATFALDSQEYYHTQYGTRLIDGLTVYPSNYAYSNIRAWLNSNFYNLAFSVDDKNIIEVTEVDNSAYSCGAGNSNYTCYNTNDRMFLLSYREVNTKNYGFNAKIDRQRNATPYALVQGIKRYNEYYPAYWWTRSPTDFNEAAVRSVDDYGDNGNQSCTATSYGIVPAMWITLP